MTAQELETVASAIGVKITTACTLSSAMSLVASS